MWASRRGGISGERRGSAGMGQVTIGGTSPAVMTEGEVRRAEILSPGFYYWAPAAGEDAMVLQAGDLGEEACLAGLRQQPPVELGPGEAAIGVPGSYLHITPNGITIYGDVRVDGSLDIYGNLAVTGKLEARDVVRLDGAVYINDIFQLAD